MASDELMRRVQALEDREAICALKSAYLAACDGKDPVAMRACFMDGPVRIDYGVIGTFDRADALVAIFTQMACHDHMVEMHHGVNPQITLIDAKRAKGHWGLHYQLINTQEKKLTQLGAYYDDEYRKTASGWKIEATRCVVTSTLVLDLSATAITSLFAGRPG
ncbi:MAG: nuclear transport factor 2 family protein [Stenotrophobium sp.]